MLKQKLSKEINIHDAIRYVNFEIYGEEWKEPEWKNLLPSDISSLLSGAKRKHYLKVFQANFPKRQREERALYTIKVLRMALMSGAIAAYYKDNSVKNFILPEQWGGNFLFAGKEIHKIMVASKDVRSLVEKIGKETKKSGPKSHEQKMCAIVQKLLNEEKINKSTPVQIVLNMVMKELKIKEGTRGWHIETFRRRTRDLLT